MGSVFHVFQYRPIPLLSVIARTEPGQFFTTIVAAYLETHLS
jgi:hypothetical protein